MFIQFLSSGMSHLWDEIQTWGEIFKLGFDPIRSFVLSARGFILVSSFLAKGNNNNKIKTPQQHQPVISYSHQVEGRHNKIDWQQKHLEKVLCVSVLCVKCTYFIETIFVVLLAVPFSLLEIT
jgi:hypothetical protein